VADSARLLARALRPIQQVQRMIDETLRTLGPRFAAVHERVGDLRFNRASLQEALAITPELLSMSLRQPAAILFVH
jgi:hypothetical protein